MNKSKIAIIISAILVVVLGLGGFFIFRNSKEETPTGKPQNPPTVSTNTNKPKPKPKAPIKQVVKTVAEKIEETNNDLAKAANAGNIVQNMSCVKNMSLENGFSKATIGDDYLFIQEMATRMFYAIEFIADNATVDNGYNEDFNLYRTYTGYVTADGLQGNVYFRLSEGENGDIKVEIDFDTNYYGHDVNYYWLGYITYDHETDTVKKFRMNQIMMPMAEEIWSMEFDYETNKFVGFQLYDDTYSHAEDEVNTFIEKYNNKTLTLEEIMNMRWTHAVFGIGKLSDNVEDLEFEGYEYSDYDTDLQQEFEVLNEMYENVTKVTKELPLRTTSFVRSYHTYVNFIQDAIDYGWNKANVASREHEGKDWYHFTYIEKDELVKYLTDLKALIAEDDEVLEIVKTSVDYALEYINSHLYTGQLGYYNEQQLKLKHSVITSQFVDHIEYWDEITIINETSHACISFDVKQGEVSLNYSYQLTNKHVADISEWFCQQEIYTEEQKAFAQEIYNVYSNIIETDTLYQYCDGFTISIYNNNAYDFIINKSDSIFSMVIYGTESGIFGYVYKVNQL